MDKVSITLQDNDFHNFTSWCYVPRSNEGPYFIICCYDIMFLYPETLKVKYIDTDLVIYDIEYVSQEVCGVILKQDNILFKHGGLIIFDNYKPMVWLYSLDLKHKILIYCDSSREYLSMSMMNCKLYILEMRRTITLFCYDLKSKQKNRIMINTDFMICCQNFLLFEDCDGLICRCPDTLNTMWFREDHEYVAQYDQYVLSCCKDEYFVLMIQSGDILKKLDHLGIYNNSRLMIADRWMIEIIDMDGNELIISSNPLLDV